MIPPYSNFTLSGEGIETKNWETQTMGTLVYKQIERRYASHGTREKKCQWCTEGKSCTWYIVHTKDYLHVSGTFESQIITAHYLKDIIGTEDYVPHISNVWRQEVHETIKSHDVQVVCNIFTAYSSAIFVIYRVRH